MILDYLSQIKVNVGIFSNKKTEGLLDGSYKSVFRGSSMNFEDLREYVPGDSIRDIDWKATSRSRKPLVKRYVAEKQHNILLVFDSGKKMLADTPSEMCKKELAILAGGTIAYIAAKNGDSVGSIYCYGDMIRHFQFKQGLYNVERILSAYDGDAGKEASYTLERSIDYIIQNIRRSMVIIIVTDYEGTSHVTEGMIKILKSRHDIMFVNIKDASLTGGLSYNVDGEQYVPKFISSNKKLMKMENNMRVALEQREENRLKRLGVASTALEEREDITKKVVELLEKHKYANVR